MASNGQQSTEQSTRNGINALEEAFNNVWKIRGDVHDTTGGLEKAYKGGDGESYRLLLADWDAKVDTILRNLREMINQLNTTLVEHGKTQGSSNDAINHAFKASEAAFAALTGGR
ncbi:hypothetical protein ACIBAC_43500 [Streptomyces sp. NPDC051362]|uniref:hypothetical protein n=1 Tax=Streptomyces sp. NPDC051362 TaxID=3365651 RepID=UPI0037BAC3A7